MSPREPAISFSELFAYTNYLANRWFGYFTEHEDALGINIGGQTSTLRNLVEHIVQVEEFFASRLLGQEPTEKPENSGLTDLLQMHKDANGKFETFLNASDDDRLRDTQMLGSRRVSNRKMLSQAALHSVHHWAQVAMAVRQAGFPTGKPQDFIITDLME